MNVYRITYDLVRETLTTTGYVKHVVPEEEPAATKLVVAPSFEDAVRKGTEIQNSLRGAAVSKECRIRDVELVFFGVMVSGVED